MDDRADELLRKISEDVALTREEIRMSREQRIRSDAMMDRLDERLDRDAEEHADLRTFIREMIVRMERSGQEVANVLLAQTSELQRFGAEFSAEMRAARKEAREARKEAHEEMRDLREESRAQTNALLRMLDRFDGPEPGGAAGTA